MKSTSTLDGIFNPISDDSLSSYPNGICNLIPDIINQQCYFRRVQIFRHSSVQSSSTFRSRKADTLIYILKFKKIEQGKLLYPKIYPLIFLNTCQVRSSNCSTKSKSGPDKPSPKTVYPKLGFCVASRSLSPNVLKFSPMS